MSIRRLYGDDGMVGGNRWEIFMLDNPTPDESTRWWAAMDTLFPPAMPGDEAPYNTKKDG